MLLFTNEQVKKALTLTHFIDFITEIAPLYDEEIPLNVVALFPWDAIQKILHEFIILGLNNLTDSDSQTPNPPYPNSSRVFIFVWQRKVESHPRYFSCSRTYTC